MKLGRFIDNLFGDVGFDEITPLEMGNDAVADLLPYRVYDPETGIYFNDETAGFIMEMPPMVQPEEAASNVHGALVAACPPEAGVQFIGWSSPNIDALLNNWTLAKSGGSAVVENMASRRAQHMRDLAFGSPHQIKSIPCNRRAFFCAWVEGDVGVAAVAKLREFRSAIAAAVGVDREASLTPSGLLGLLREIFQAEDYGRSDELYTEQLPINAQIPGVMCQVGSGQLSFGAGATIGATVQSVARFPKEWAAQLTELLYGDPDRITDRPHGPILTTLTAVSIPASKSGSDMMVALGKMEHAQTSGLARFTSNFAEKKAEFQELTQALDAGERLFKTVMTVVSYVKNEPGAVKSAASEMRKIYRRGGLMLRDEQFVQLPMFLASLPLVPTQQMIATLARMQRMRLLKGAALTSLTPIFGEWKGNSSGAGVLLQGRQGQLLCWNNFISEGNYNVSVVGKSGAGKSVFMQELVTSIFSNGGKVLVIDDGYSFQNTCDVMDGSHIAFGGGREVRLNPFSMLDAEKMDQPEYAADAVGLVTGVIASMAALGEQREGRVVGMEEQFINAAVREVWQDLGPQGEISNVRDVLERQSREDARLIDVVARLEPFCHGGVYASYFSGPANLRIDNDFTVVELSDIKSQKALEAAVLQLVMFLGTELMFKTDRSVPVAILIDEAWDMLKGEGTAAFIEGVVRRARKYTGALITGTQSIDDYFALPAAEVCLQNSDWTVFLAQKPETIDRLEEAKRLSIPPGFGARLKTVTSVPGQFSEMAIKGAGGWAFGRLLLDGFSLAAYSSKGATVKALHDYKESGLTTVQALERLAESGEAR